MSYLTLLVLQRDLGKLTLIFVSQRDVHLGSIEETYTTIKSILLEELLDTMRESFTHTEKYLDIETIKEDEAANTMDLTYA